MRTRRRLLLLLACVLLAAPVGSAQNVSGTVFEDLDGDGVRDAGEPALEGVGVELFGRADSGATVDATETTDALGTFAFSPGNGCYLVNVVDPPGWRRTLTRFEEYPEGSSGYQAPVGQRRFGVAPELFSALRSGGTVRYSSLGDSIAYNWNSCFDSSSFYYSQQVRDRLRCVNPAATVNLDEAAIKGEHSDDLLVDETGELNNVFRMIDAQPEFVTISMIGNDLLNDEPEGDDPTQDEINRFVAEMIDSRQNLQEALASLVSEIPGATIELNTLYDNLAYACDSSRPHNEWLPIFNRMLRDLAWGQARRVTNAEVYAEFANEDLLGACTGFEDQICLFADGIHPRHTGYRIIREKVWESINGVSLGSRDAIGATTIDEVDHGYLRRVARLLPRDAEALGGATLSDAEAAFDDDDAGAVATVRLGIGAEEVRFSGFPSWLDEIDPVKVIAGVRYRTSGSVTDDYYRIEASVDGAFRPPPGHAYAPTEWNFFTPIVGGGGPNAPVESPDYGDAELLVVPEVATLREASATLTKNPELSPDGAGYVWPAITRDELGTTEVRVAAAPVAGTAGDDYAVLVDAVWLDVYGVEKPRPSEITGVTVAKDGAGGLVVAFDALADSELYNVYFGDLPALSTDGTLTHGDDVLGDRVCDAPTEDAGPGRLQTTLDGSQVPAGSSYLLVTGRVDGVESPAGSTSDGSERDRSQNVCP